MARTRNAAKKASPAPPRAKRTAVKAFDNDDNSETSMSVEQRPAKRSKKEIRQEECLRAQMFIAGQKQGIAIPAGATPGKHVVPLVHKPPPAKRVPVPFVAKKPTTSTRVMDPSTFALLASQKAVIFGYPKQQQGGTVPVPPRKSVPYSPSMNTNHFGAPTTTAAGPKSRKSSGINVYNPTIHEVAAATAAKSNDAGYRTGDSDEEVYAARHRATKKRATRGQPLSKVVYELYKDFNKDGGDAYETDDDDSVEEVWIAHRAAAGSKAPSWLKYSIPILAAVPAAFFFGDPTTIISTYGQALAATKDALVGLSSSSMPIMGKAQHSSPSLVQDAVVDLLKATAWTWSQRIIVSWFLWLLRKQLWKLVMWGCRSALMWAWSKMKGAVTGKPSSAAKVSNNDVKNATSMALCALQSMSSHFHKPANLRDDIKKQIHPSAQARFHNKVWPAVVKNVEKDKRVRVAKTNDGPVWKWQG